MKHRTVALPLSLLTLAALTGCGSLSMGGSQERDKVTVWLMQNSASKGFLAKFEKEYEAENGDVDLDIRIQEWTGIGEKVNEALASDDASAPDVIEIGNTQVAQYVDQGGVLDLSLESMRDLGMEDWLPGLAEPGSVDGSQFGIPWYAANRVVLYNKDLFAAAGIKNPPKDREEWIAQTEELNSGSQQGIYLAGQDWYTLAGFIWEEGGELAVDKDGTWTGTLESPQALAGMDFYARLQALGKGPKDADEQTPPQTDVFAKGKVAQIITVPGAAKLIEEANPELAGKIGYFPVPGKQAGRPGAVFTGGSDLVIPERTDQEWAAMNVVKALAGERWQKELATTMDYVPNKTTLASVVDGKPGVAAMAEGAVRGRATPNSPRWAAVEADNPIKRYMTDVLTGADPEETAREASRQITKLLDTHE
ncbi:extracellular solute-binding protein [Streptomyces sp. TRM66268-LWL]|uniref:Extracellular solute-binding protein n=1 Tax=Streptomyces polyasparticus TaxID=2767826 RepID=A0ABR7SFS6_9ACTN|nr:extracellular solute-binding protein [Streptomyces polyasparticus]MBC9713837.1 extracellular solute-binding protein [Streptomyces polyasparticus]